MTRPLPPLRLSFPADWEDSLWAAVRSCLPSRVLEQRSLVAAIQRRTVLYTTARDRLGHELPSAQRPADLAARAVFYAVADAPKVSVPVTDLCSRGLLLAGGGRLRVLDLGAGTGAMTIGLAAALPDRVLDATAVDRDGEALDLFSTIASQLPTGIRSLRVERIDVPATMPAAVGGRFDVVLVGSLLNELAPPARLGLVASLLQDYVSTDGALILIEPALRETARDLHDLRDALVTGEGAIAAVVGPCTHNAPCPALHGERDWCHEDRPFAPPPRLGELARASGLRRHGAKFSYLALLPRGRPAPAPIAPAGQVALRVVSDCLDSKGVIERIVCGSGGWARLRMLRRDRSSAAGRLVAKSQRGDVLVAEDGADPNSIIECRSPAI
ncbi:MAG: small ribosomal subunit Rsm22 family protein [Pseudomonadota bacterium]